MSLLLSANMACTSLVAGAISGTAAAAICLAGSTACTAERSPPLRKYIRFEMTDYNC
eukprot:SAG11_NODE_22484_length_405_cov_0.970588_1_plen_56_part_01